jgi:hypothetical protein
MLPFTRCQYCMRLLLLYRFDSKAYVCDVIQVIVVFWEQESSIPPNIYELAVIYYDYNRFWCKLMYRGLNCHCVYQPLDSENRANTYMYVYIQYPLSSLVIIGLSVSLFSQHWYEIYMCTDECFHLLLLVLCITMQITNYKAVFRGSFWIRGVLSPSYTPRDIFLLVL